MNQSERKSIYNEFGVNRVHSVYSLEELDEGDYKIVHMVLGRKCPAHVQNVGDRYSGRDIDRAHRSMERLEQEAAGPVNIARGVRTPGQQRKVYDKVFAHNQEMAQRGKTVRKTRGSKDSGMGRFELAGQVPREAFLEEVRTSGKGAQEILMDPDAMDSLAKKSGWKVDD